MVNTPHPIVVAPPNWRNPDNESATSNYPTQEDQVALISEVMGLLGIESNYQLARVLSVPDRSMVVRWMQTKGPRQGHMSAKYWWRLCHQLIQLAKGNTAFLEASKRRSMYSDYKEDE